MFRSANSANRIGIARDSGDVCISSEYFYILEVSLLRRELE